MLQWRLWWEGTPTCWLSKLVTRDCGKRRGGAVASLGEAHRLDSPSLPRGDTGRQRRGPDTSCVPTHPTVHSLAHQYQLRYRFVQPLVKWREANEQRPAPKSISRQKQLIPEMAMGPTTGRPSRLPRQSQERGTTEEAVPSLAAQFVFLHPSELRAAFPSY